MIHKSNGAGFTRLINAVNCSLKGFKAAYIHETAFRQELLLSVILFPFSFVIAASSTQWLILVCSLLFLLFSELFNSAIEALSDQVSLEHHELIGRAKDLAAGGGLIALIIVLLTWGVFTYQYLTKI